MTTRQLAAKFIDDQLDIIKKHGGKPKLSADRRRIAIAETERTFDAMRERAEANGSSSHHSDRKLHV